ncbi:hypothetical protein CC80DRAFT_518793 [Byssothecium circinans]|uniref:C2H2-type domain-containing protein n=1 Tax=Byssothecium circinans TaxID=147558 RepID=A0A6A5TI55_9PLEO|nr:hypothetical protein CC80DRAFT_518793 [Byssothecium circinans]
MRRRSPVKGSSESKSSFSESDYTGPNSDADDGVESDTDPTDVDASADEGDEDEDEAWLSPNEDHPPEYYLQQLETFDEQDYTKEDYKDSSTRLIDRMEDQWHHSLGTYWKVFRLVYERATGVKLDGKMNRSMHKVLRKLAKKHGLTKIGRDKACMYVEDLALVLQTNLVTTEKRYPHGRCRIQAQLYLQLGGFTANRPQALLSLCYRHIQVTLLRDPEGGPHRVLLEFTFEFTKQFLGVKDMNTFPLFEVIYDETLIFSPHVFLLGVLFCDQAFAAYNLTSPEELSRLTIPPGRNELPLRLNRALDDIPVFRKAERTPYGWTISPTEPLPYSTLLPWIRTLGKITGFAQVTRPYSLRYAAGKAFNENGELCELSYARCRSNINLMMGHASISTFLKHYLSRRVTVDTQAVVRGIQPQTALMRATCTMSRSIDRRRPRRLTPEQTALVNDDPTVRSLLNRRERLKCTLTNATKRLKYKALTSEINRARQRCRHTLLQEVQERWEYEQPVRDVERQLAGFGVDVEDQLEVAPCALPQAQQELVGAIFARPGLTLDEELDRRNTAICAVMRYCAIEEGGMRLSQTQHSRHRIKPPSKNEDDAQLDLNEKVLEVAKVAVYKEKRPTICFLCLGNQRLRTDARTYSFHTSGDLSKHFKRKHLQQIKEGDQLSCDLCQVCLGSRMHLQRHALDIHGTVS